MSLIKDIKINLALESKAFTASAAEATKGLDALAASAKSTQSAVNGLDLAKLKGTGSIPGAGASAAASPAASPASSAPSDFGSTVAAVGVASASIQGIGSQISNAFTQGLAPLDKIGTQITGMVNQIGGIIEHLAQRIERSMKLTAVNKTFDDIKRGIQTKIANASGAAVDSLTQVQQATLALGPAAIRAISAFQKFQSLKSAIASLLPGRAVQPLQRLAAVRFNIGAASARQLSKSVNDVGSAAKAAAAPIKRVGFEIAAALGVVGLIYKGTQALIGFFSGGIKGAVSLVETQNKVKETFGASAGVVDAQAQRMAKSFGIPKGASLDVAASFGLIAQGAGQSQAASAGLANTMSQLAADTASFYHIPIGDALEKIKSGLAGESKPLRELGVNLSEAAVKAEGVAMGFIKQNQELDEAGKIAARSSLIVKGLAKADGDLARTSDSTANQLMIFKGNLTNLATSVGTLLLPIVNKAITMFSGFAATASAAFESSKASIEPFIAKVVGGFDLVRDVFSNFPTYAKIAWLKVEEAAINGLSWVETLPKNLSILGSYVANNWSKLMVDGVKAVGSAFMNLSENVGRFFTAMHDWATGKGWNFEWKGLLDGFKATADKLPDFVKPQLVSFDAEIKKLWEDAAKAKAPVPEAPKPAPPPKAALPKDLIGGAAPKEKSGEKAKEGTTAAAELHSTEAASAIAKFRNQGSADPAVKATAKNTLDTAKGINKLQIALMEIAHRGGSAQLSSYSF